MKALYQENTVQKLKESALSRFEMWQNFARKDCSESVMEILSNARQEANLAGEELLEKYKSRSEEKGNAVNRILSFIENNYICEEDKKIFDRILGDAEILSKLVFISDGSFRNHRIFYKKFGFPGIDRTAFRIEDVCSDGGSQLDILNHIKDNYECIFIHLVSDEQALEDYYEELWSL